MTQVHHHHHGGGGAQAYAAQQTPAADVAQIIDQALQSQGAAAAI